MLARMTLVLILVGSVATATSGIAGEAVEDLMAATFRITDDVRSGTCFFVSGKAVDSDKPNQVVLVTAAHVFEQMEGPECELILRTVAEDKTYQRKVVTIDIRDESKPRWTRHPDVDIATLLVDLPDDVVAHRFLLDQIADESRITDRTIRVGRNVWISCFPAKVESNCAGWPVLRKGSIASHPLEPVKAQKTMLVDSSVFGGDSGSPVAIIVNGRPLIVGVTASMQRQTDRISIPFEERTMHTPLGLSIVVHATYLRETIKLMMTE